MGEKWDYPNLIEPFEHHSKNLSTSLLRIVDGLRDKGKPPISNYRAVSVQEWEDFKRKRLDLGRDCRGDEVPRSSKSC